MRTQDFLLPTAVVLFSDAAFAETASGSSVWREVVIWGVPALVLFLLWYTSLRKTLRRTDELTERTFVHMDELEQKVDRIISILERRRG